ncbi:hypothetical protein ATC04_18575 (plasmid) [Arthrobacter sp. YC-RL1]|nr:hypothetical protein ATC04_18575 [Arthrobacter sp. YC-RL1]
MINILTMQRTEYQVDGPLTQLARDVLGFGDTAELGKRAEEADEASHYASVKFQPNTHARRTFTMATSMTSNPATRQSPHRPKVQGRIRDAPSRVLPCRCAPRSIRP